MGIQILGADGSTLADVDASSHAIRTSAYDQAGNSAEAQSQLGVILNALNAELLQQLGGQTTLGINIASTTGTITAAFEGTIDNINWSPLLATPTVGGALTASTSINGQWVVGVGGFFAIRIRISAITGPASMIASTSVTPGGSTLAVVQVSVTEAIELRDGVIPTNLATIKSPSTPAVATDPALVVAISPNNPISVSGTVEQGTPAPLAGAWPVEITDGTSVLGTSTHPVRIDPTGTTPQPVSSPLEPPKYDYVSLSYTGSNLTEVQYYLGGSGGTLMATLTLAYSGSNLISVAKT